MLCNTYQMWFTELKSSFLFFSGTSTCATTLSFLRIWWKLYFGSDNVDFLHDNVLGVSGDYRITVSFELLTRFTNLVSFNQFSQVLWASFDINSNQSKMIWSSHFIAGSRGYPRDYLAIRDDLYLDLEGSLKEFCSECTKGPCRTNSLSWHC